MDKFEEVGRKLDEELGRLRRFVEEDLAPKTEEHTAQFLREVSEKLTNAASWLDERRGQRATWSVYFYRLRRVRCGGLRGQASGRGRHTTASFAFGNARDEPGAACSFLAASFHYVGRKKRSVRPAGHWRLRGTGQCLVVRAALPWTTLFERRSLRHEQTDGRAPHHGLQYHGARD